VIAGALMVTALAFAVEGVLAVVQRLLTPKALREEEGAAELLAPVIEGT
jgi:ABC-type proline/glycine betaine transport system permease subunit